MRKDDVVEYFGDQTKLARAIGITAAAVSQWPALVPKSRRTSIRLAMRELANELEAEAKRLRRAAKECGQ